MITFTAQQGAFHKNCFYRVIGQEDNDIICGCTSSKNLRLDISSTQNFTVLRPLQLSLAEGNKVRWTTTLRERSIIRHRSMTVLELNAHKIVLQDSFNNKKIVLDTTDEVVKYLDYDYANICYTVQSRTSKNVLMILDSHRQNLIAVKNFYTGISRTNDHLLLLTDDGEKSLRLLQQRNGIQSNAMDLPSTRILTTKYRMLEEISR
jgi:hypothetical protein